MVVLQFCPPGPPNDDAHTPTEFVYGSKSVSKQAGNQVGAHLESVIHDTLIFSAFFSKLYIHNSLNQMLHGSQVAHAELMIMQALDHRARGGPLETLTAYMEVAGQHCQNLSWRPSHPATLQAVAQLQMLVEDYQIAQEFLLHDPDPDPM